MGARQQNSATWSRARRGTRSGRTHRLALQTPPTGDLSASTVLVDSSTWCGSVVLMRFSLGSRARAVFSRRAVRETRMRSIAWDATACRRVRA